LGPGVEVPLSLGSRNQSLGASAASFANSSIEYARTVVVLAFPAAEVAIANFVMASPLGISSVRTTSEMGFGENERPRSWQRSLPGRVGAGGDGDSRPAVTTPRSTAGFDRSKKDGAQKATPSKLGERPVSHNGAFQKDGGSSQLCQRLNHKRVAPSTRLFQSPATLP